MADPNAQNRGDAKGDGDYVEGGAPPATSSNTQDGSSSSQSTSSQADPNANGGGTGAGGDPSASGSGSGGPSESGSAADSGSASNSGGTSGSGSGQSSGSGSGSGESGGQAAAPSSPTSTSILDGGVVNEVVHAATGGAAGNGVDLGSLDGLQVPGLGNVGSVVGNAGTLAGLPADGIGLLNQLGQQANASVDGLATSAGLPNTGDGLSGASSTAGVGHIGDGNLITEVIRAPGDIASGETPAAEAADLVREAGRTVSATGDAIQNIGTDLGSPNLADGAFGTVGGLLGGELGHDTGGTSISASVGESGGSPIVDQGLLHAAPGGSPVGVAVGDPLGIGNVAEIHLADGTSGSAISGDAGAGGSPLAVAGVLTNADSSSPIGIDLGNGTNVADASLLGASPLPGDVADGVRSLGLISDADGGSSAVSGNAGTPGGMPLANAGLFADPTNDTPLGVDALSGANMLNADALGSAPHDALAALSANGDTLGVGNIADASLLGSTMGNVISGDAGASGGSPLAVASLLTEPSSSSPVAVQFGEGQNVADASLLGDSTTPQSVADTLGRATQSLLGQQNDSVVSGDAGLVGGSPLASAGVLTSPTPEGPLSVDALSGANAVAANLTGSADHLHFPNLGGAGLDSLNGIAPSLPHVADAGSIVGEGDSGQPLVDVANDGALVQVHNDPSSLLGLNHTAVI